MITKAVHLLCLCFCMGLGTIALAQDQYDPTRWEETIQAFEKQDKQSPPPKDAILFIGSSSIRMWDLDQWFPIMETMNRGFGGSHIEDSVYYANRIVIPYKPRIIVFYAGDNDISAGKTPKQVFSDYTQFVMKVHEALPETKIIYICIKPSLSRWDKVDAMRKANQMIENYCRKHTLLDYVDIDTPMIGEDGKPKEELFLDDGLHLNEKGYRLWTQKVRPYLKEAKK